MSEPVWLRRDVALSLHDQQLAEHGGLGGLRDAGLLESALARAQNAWSYGEEDLCFLAALYADGVMQNHPFTDGNKRTGFLAAYVFLHENGLELIASEVDAVLNCLALAAGETDERVFADWLRENVRAL